MTTVSLIAKTPRMEIYRQVNKAYKLYVDGEYICDVRKSSNDMFTINDALHAKELEKFLSVNSEDFLDGLDLYFDENEKLLHALPLIFSIRRGGRRITVDLGIEAENEFPERDTAFISMLRKMGKQCKAHGLEVIDFEHCLEDGFAIFELEKEVGEYIGTLRDTLREKIKNLMIASGAPAD